MSEYIPPRYGSSGFHCLYCQFYAAQEWWSITLYNKFSKIRTVQPLSIDKMEVEVSRCARCQKPTFWLGEKIIYPPTHTFPPANSDLPDDVQGVYEEAAAIANQSPRAACALLRLAIEMLLKDLDYLGKRDSLFNSIGKMVEAGLDKSIQKSLDALRTAGNNAVHTGRIDIHESIDVQALFRLINLIAHKLITEPKEIDEIYDFLSDTEKEAIEDRDGKN